MTKRARKGHSLRSKRRQKHFLLGSFVLLFAVSAGLILLERIEKQNSARLASPARPAAPTVQGESAALDNANALYRREAALIMAKLNVFLAGLEKGEAARAEAGKLTDDLLRRSVPAAYQKLHFQLVTFLRHIQTRAQPDLDYLLEQRRLMLEEWPWLPGQWERAS